ncbi:hypothetical protein E1293_32420 [Actinomadura darangshiensis]|uniref:Uncharacterized protein n=1 Tax=Actinomadura darangshiensis TaxID=705336 RepID=A0A4R5AJ36_9ACTN|nr:hypothetical protein [Actinomadura darangshiensis]TDD72808.1 hypothetical protein E1293_32420 [Actinomadura darangshiensis]
MITGTRLLLPAAVAAASIVAMTVPATAQDAPPPAPQTSSQDQERCTKALSVLSVLKLLPSRPDFQRALCSLDQDQEQGQEQPQGRPQGQQASDDYTDQISSKYTDDSGRTVEENKLLGLPVEWPKSLTVHVPTLNDHWYTYTSKKP